MHTNLLRAGPLHDLIALIKMCRMVLIDSTANSQLRRLQGPHLIFILVNINSRRYVYVTAIALSLKMSLCSLASA